MDDIEIVSVHYKTPELIYNQYKTVRNFYPKVKYQIIDGSDDGKIYFEDLEKNDSNFTVKRFGYNIHHGPGMDYAIKNSKHKFLLILDSDVSLKKPLIEEMMKNFKGYSVGKIIKVNSRGYESWQKDKKGDNNFIYHYTHPYCILINKEEYIKHKPFIKHGAPCIESMVDLHNKNLSHLLSDFKITDYVDLKIRGTRGKWGINL